MSWSTIWAKASISVTPGSETLWSVHSGQRCWTSRLASSTRSWKERSSRSGTGSTVSALQPGHGAAVRPGRRGAGVLGDDVEGEDEVARVVGAPDGVAQVDVDGPGVGAVEPDPHVDHLDAGFPARQCGADLVGDLPGGRGVGRPEDEVVDAAAELRAHRPLARHRAEDQPDGLLELPLAGDERDAAGRVGAHRERPPGPDEPRGQIGR